jgi:hypothetical protein
VDIQFQDLSLFDAHHIIFQTLTSRFEYTIRKGRAW